MGFFDSVGNFLSKKPANAMHVVGIKESGIGLVGNVLSPESNKEGEENDRELISKAITIYDNFPLAKNAVDSQAEQAVTDFSFEGPDKDFLNEFSEEFDLAIHLNKIATMLGKTGICFVEAPKDNNEANKYKIKELKILDWEEKEPTLTIHRYTNGTVIGVTQEKNGKDCLWGSTGHPEQNSEYKKRKPLNQMIIFKIGSGKYGQPLTRPTIHLFEALDKIEAKFPDLVDRYTNPIVHAKVGDETTPATTDDVDDVADMLTDIYSDTEYATSHLVDMSVLEFRGKGIDVAPIIEHIERQITKGLREPELTGNDGRLAEVKLKFSNRHILAIQRKLKAQIESKLIQGLLGLSNENKIVFENPDERDKEAEYDRLIQLVQTGIITPQKANDLLPEKYREKLAADTADTADATPSADNAGTKKVNTQDNPTDPTKSTKSVPGRRIKRTDKKPTIDDDGENQKSRDKK